MCVFGVDNCVTRTANAVLFFVYGGGQCAAKGIVHSCVQQAALTGSVQYCQQLFDLPCLQHIMAAVPGANVRI